MNARNLLLGAVAAAGVLAGIAYWYTEQGRPGTDPEARPAAPAVAQAPAPSPAPAASEPAIRYPLDQGSQSLGAAEVVAGLNKLLGRQAVQKFVLTDDFARRVVATVDNLGRRHAPAAVWPVAPTPGRFATDPAGTEATIAVANGERYTPFVVLVERTDVKEALGFYRSVYPLLQNAYQDLGFPRRYFNDRLVEVIDLLLATPQLQQPASVRLLEVRGPHPSERPWVHYEFSDPALESLSAGQKILLRMGPDNERRLKAKLRDFRQAVTAPTAMR